MAVVAFRYPLVTALKTRSNGITLTFRDYTRMNVIALEVIDG